MHELKISDGLISAKCPFHTFMAGLVTAGLVIYLVDWQKKKDKPTVNSLIEKYNLMDHPEGGYFVETFKSKVDVKVDFAGKKVDRQASTAIYFLIIPGNISRLHRIKSDEVWHFYLGGPMTVIELDNTDPKGYRATILGSNVLKGELVQYTVKAGVWFGSFPNEGSEYSFVGCTVAPGFEFEDFEMGNAAFLCREFPNATEIIQKMTKHPHDPSRDHTHSHDKSIQDSYA